MKAIVIVLVLACAALTQAADEPSPSPARAQLERFVAAFNANDKETLAAFMRDFASPPMQQDEPILLALEWFRDLGRFEIVEVIETNEFGLTGVVRTLGNQTHLGLALEVDTVPPYRIHQLLFGSSDIPEKYLPKRVPDAEAAEAWQTEVQRLTGTGRFSGAIYYARGGKVLARAAYGFADRERQLPNTTETRFRTASVTKMFTAVAVLRLVQERRISLDDPLGKWIPELANQPLGLGTVHQYLTHTAGAGDLFDDRYFGHQRELRTHDDYLRTFGKDLLKMPPGEEFEYSNLGYMLLGSLIERVTGRSYYEVVRKTVFSRAGMTRTGTEPEDVPVEGRAIGYDRPLGTGTVVSAMDHIDYRPFAACGAYTTVDDLARFFAALRARRLLNAKYTGLMLTPTLQADDGSMVGYGVRVRGKSREHWIGHDGVDRGMNAAAWFSPETDRVVIVLSNFDKPAAEAAHWFLADRLSLD